MPGKVQPFFTQFTRESLTFTPSEKKSRRLSEMTDIFADGRAYADLMAAGDRVVYDMLNAAVPEEDGHLLHSVTIIHPGSVGKEFFMTAGHFHLDRLAPEVYSCLAGRGALLVMDREGDCSFIPMTDGTVAYIPPGWAHRTVNTGTEPFAFLAVWPAGAGHDYGTIKETGFSRLVLDDGGGNTKVVDNPNFRSISA